ncbi:MAG: hypothetical protein Tp152DCM223801_27 [Prokaryotic dsDNA virus sp.]|nr:MAG: hypothetical protein Tp152DCM223801_27 [Prokaryotic dsDNA virus sp.]|tara:strand:+ start:465 stop:659 length:195 start_codon:yes stop_codon:yes gene_type:complete
MSVNEKIKKVDTDIQYIKNTLSRLTFVLEGYVRYTTNDKMFTKMLNEIANDMDKAIKDKEKSEE